MRNWDHMKSVIRGSLRRHDCGTLSDSQILRSVGQTACCSRAWLAGSDHAAVEHNGFGFRCTSVCVPVSGSAGTKLQGSLRQASNRSSQKWVGVFQMLVWKENPWPPEGNVQPWLVYFSAGLLNPHSETGGRLDFPSNQKSNTKDNIPTYLWNRKKLKACCKWFHHLCIRVWHFLTCKKSDEIRRKLRSFFTKISKDSRKGKSTKA